jgi:hypothetical protein
MPSFYRKDKSMKLNTLAKSMDELNNAQLRKAEDFQENLNELVHKANEREKGEKITPCAGNKDFSTCVTAVNNKLVLWYNDKTGSTKIVEKQI